MLYSDFRWNGNLKPGIEDLDPDGFFRKYVVPFPFSSSRGNLFRMFVDYLKELDAFGIMRGIFVAGSFVTLKEHPHDMDMICCFSGEAFDRLSSEEANRVMPYLTDPVAMMRRFGVQPFPLPVYHVDDEPFPLTKFSADLTISILGTDRASSPKGLVYMDWEDVGQALTGGELESMVKTSQVFPSRPDDRWVPLYGKDETTRRRHLEHNRQLMAEVSDLAKKFPAVPSTRVLVHFLFCSLLYILGAGDEPPGR